MRTERPRRKRTLFILGSAWCAGDCCGCAAVGNADSSRLAWVFIGAKRPNCTLSLPRFLKEFLLAAMLLFSTILGSQLGGSMKNLFQREAVDELIARIDQLHPATQRQWGKMDVAQMMAHCSAALDMASGRLNPQRAMIGRLIGPLFKSIYTNEKLF